MKLPTNWTAEQALAVHDCLADIADAVWRQYKEALNDVMYERYCDEEAERRERAQTALLNDEIPF